MIEATIQVESSSPVPVYRQIVDQLRLHLHTGSLAPGERLPSVRSLAAQLGVHFHTIAEAYRELADEGWIDLGHGRRAVVLPRGGPRALPAAEAEVLRGRLHRLLAEMLLKGMSAAMIQRDVTGMLEG